MGCGTSKNQVRDVTGVPAEQHGKQQRQKRGQHDAPDPDTVSITSQERGGSATSKISRHSGDSGFDDEEEQRQRDALLRRPLPLLSSKSEQRVEEKQLLETLHEEGLIQRPIGRGAFSVSFEVMSEFDATVRRPPPRLAKLECRKKRKKPLTADEIKQKLDQAELRRKEVEQQRLDKIHSLHRADLLPAIESTQHPPESEQGAGDGKSRAELVAENRERKLREKLERLKAKEAHAEAVRQRKLAALMNTMTDDGADDVCNTNNNNNNNNNAHHNSTTTAADTIATATTHSHHDNNNTDHVL